MKRDRPFRRDAAPDQADTRWMKSPHILNAASNLLGVTVAIIAALHLTRVSGHTVADEIALAVAVCLTGCCFLSYLALRSERVWMERVADGLFLLAQLMLLAAVGSLWLL